MSIHCKLCKQSFEKINYLTHHLSSTHKIDCNSYIRDNFIDFVSYGWKFCNECKSPFKGRSEKCGWCYSKNHIIKDQYVTCGYCNEKIHSKVLSQHLKLSHGILFENYLKDNLEDFKKFGWEKCAICQTITKKQGKKHRPTCSRKCMGELRKIEYKGRKGTKHTEETKKKISEIKTGIPNFKIRGYLNPAKRKDVRKKISKIRIERGLAKGKNNPMYGKTHTPEAIKKIMSHRPMNKLEKIVADELNRLNLKYSFQFFINENGICKSYDFKIKRKPIIIEVDGDFWHGNPNTKNHHINVEDTKQNDNLKEKIAKNRGYTIIRLWESDIKKDVSIVSDKLKKHLFI